MGQTQTANVERIPEHMRSNARAYVKEGKRPGGFLRNVLANDLVGAFGRADSTNSAHMKAWTLWLYNDIPKSAWGSEEAVGEWVDQGGLEGQ